MLEFLSAIVLVVLGAVAMITSVVLFIIGITTRRRRFWLSAIGGAVLSALLMVGGAAWGGWVVVGGVRKMADDMFAGSDANMREWFVNGTELELPQDAQYLAGRNYAAWLGEIYIKIRIPPEFATVLESRFSRMKEMPKGLHASRFILADQPGWNSAVTAKGIVYYETETGGADDGGHITSLALDKDAGILYCAILEYAP